MEFYSVSVSLNIISQLEIWEHKFVLLKKAGTFTYHVANVYTYCVPVSSRYESAATCLIELYLSRPLL